jgi:hypothetical protein
VDIEGLLSPSVLVQIPPSTPSVLSPRPPRSIHAKSTFSLALFEGQE